MSRSSLSRSSRSASVATKGVSVAQAEQAVRDGNHEVALSFLADAQAQLASIRSKYE
jgi:hypothetical protein